MPQYTDAQIVGILQKAARRVNRELCLTGTASQLILDSTGEITSPTTSDVEDLRDLLYQQAECLISQREYQQELRDADGGSLVRDGEQIVDDRNAGLARGTFWETEHNPCTEVRRAYVLEKLRRQSGRMVY